MQVNFQAYQQPTKNTRNTSISAQKSHATMPGVSFSGHKLIETFNVPNYKNVKGYIYNLTNNHKVIIVPKPGIVSINTIVKTGSFNERPNESGTRHATEHLLYCGSKNLKPQESMEISEKLGAEANAFTHTYATMFYQSIAQPTQQDTEKIISSHAQMLQHPKIPKEQFEKEKEVVIKEIKEYQDDPETIQQDLVTKLLLGIKGDKDTVLGSEEDLIKMTRQDIMKNHRQNYTPDNMTTIIVGDVNLQKTINLVDKCFDTKDFRSKAAPAYYVPITPLAKTKVQLVKNNRIQIPNVSIGFIGPKNNSGKEIEALSALLNILSQHKNSRLNKKLNKFDTEAAMSLDNLTNNPNGHTSIGLEYTVYPGSEQKTLNAVSETLKEIKTKPIKQEELDVAKRNILYEFRQDSQKSTDLAKGITDYSILGFNQYKNRVANINSLTPEDVQKAAQYLDVKKAAVVVMTPQNSKLKNLTFSGAKPLQMRYIKQKTLPNNLTLTINNNPDMLTSAAKLIIKTDSPVKIGVPTLLSIMMENRTKNYSPQKLAQIKAAKNIKIGVNGQKSGIQFEAESQDQSLTDMVKLMKESLLNPGLNMNNFLKSKRELQMDLDSETLKATPRAIEQMYLSSSMGITNNKIKKELKKVKLEDIISFHDLLMKNGRISVAITSNTPQDGTPIKEIEQELTQIPIKFKKHLSAPVKKSFAPEKTKIEIQTEKQRAGSEIVQLFDVPTDDIKDIAAMRILNSILSGGMTTSRLFSDMREQQKLCYYVGTKYEQIAHNGQFIFKINTDILDKNKKQNTNIEKSLRGFQKHINMLINTPVDNSELSAAKKSVKMDIFSATQTPADQSDAISRNFPTENNPEYCNELLDEINKIKPQDIQRVAQKFLSKPSVISIVTTDAAFKHNQKFIQSLGDLSDSQA